MAGSLPKKGRIACQPGDCPCNVPAHVMWPVSRNGSHSWGTHVFRPHNAIATGASSAGCRQSAKRVPRNPLVCGAALRHRKFFSIEELNQAIRELRDRINQRPFRKREGSRASQFAALDKPALNPLPAEPFDLSQWSRARVNIDYHIVFDTNFYSVPYNLVQELVEVRSTPTTVELFHKGQRVASHLRARGHGHTVTIAEHRPRSHQAHLEWTPSRMVHWAQTIGPNTARLFERIMNDKPHPEMGYRSCLGIIRLAGQYSPARMEAAAERALLMGACRYQSVKSILKNSLDTVPPVEPLPSSPPPPHDNIRGAEYFD